MRNLILCLLAFCLVGMTAQAQTPAPYATQYSLEGGAEFYAATTPHAAAHFSVLVGLTPKTRSYTTVEMRPILGQPTYSTQTGIEYELVKSASGRVALNGYGQVGIATTQTATSGLLVGGGNLAIQIKPNWQLILGLEAAQAPAAGGMNPLAKIGVRYTINP